MALIGSSASRGAIACSVTAAPIWLDGGADADRLTGGSGYDRLILRKGEADSDVITDFAGNVTRAGDELHLVGWGEGTTMTRIEGTTQYQITDGVDAVTATITITGSFAAADVFFG